MLMIEPDMFSTNVHSCDMPVKSGEHYMPRLIITKRGEYIVEIVVQRNIPVPPGRQLCEG